MGRIRSSLWLFLGLVLFAVSIYDTNADVTPSENECRPYIEKAIHELKNTEATATETESTEDNNTGEEASIETITTTAEEADGESRDDDGKNDSVEIGQDDGNSQEAAADDDDKASAENESKQDDQESTEQTADDVKLEEGQESQEKADEGQESQEKTDDDNDTKEEVEAADDGDSKEQADDGDSKEQADDGDSKEQTDDGDSKEQTDDGDSKEQTDDGDSKEKSDNDDKDSKEDDTPSAEANDNDSKEEKADNADDDSKEADNSDDGDSKEAVDAQTEEQVDDEAKSEQDNEESSENEQTQVESLEENENTAAEDDGDSKEEANESEQKESVEDQEAQTAEEDQQNDTQEDEEGDTKEDDNQESVEEEKVRSKRSIPDEATSEGDDNDSTADETADESTEANADDNKSQEEEAEANDTQEDTKEESSEDEKANDDDDDSKEADAGEQQSQEEEDDEKSEESMPEEDLTMEFEIPKNLRSREHISDLLGLDAESSIKENALKRTGDVILKELKKTYDSAIRPLEGMYKYRDLSNRHFGDPEIFSKPLVLFMGPWSGGKSTILNYLTDNEYTPHSIRSGAEPSPAHFNIMMYGDEPEVLDGTQLAADWTFSGLQKFGQGLMDRLRGQKLPNKLLERVNIVEIPGILEVRKQVSRYFPFNDACQWFIDRADIIFLVYDPSKLDVGPETEAILDQLKGREYQTRILLNKGDQVKPEELLRVQGALIWNISPLMSSAQPPVMYTVSLWSHPFEQGAPVRLLQAQERALLTDLREAIDKRIENKIASARRFAVRIRNHAKMVDCYLTTYYNQKSLFSNKKQISDKIIEHPQNYNIYEGLSTLTNISRYDLPDPEVYLDFFRLNPLYEFKKLSETCTYFKGCPINKLDIAIAYDLPELVGKYKKLMEENYSQLRKEFDENCNQSEPEPPIKINTSR